MTLASLRLLKVFIASPGDLTDERRTAHEVVERVNRVYARELGWRVELLGWEDTLPGAGRPQALINKDLDECDLFLGALWRRWGHKTGTHSSGFEEEYERAQARRVGTGVPDIWVFFKHVDARELADAGPQLKKVLKFRARAAHECLYKDFCDLDDWREKIEELLSRFVARLARQQSETNQAGASSNQAYLPELGTTNSEMLPATESEYPKQLVEVAQVITRVLAGHDSTGTEALSRFIVSRMFLVSASWMASFTSDVLGVHEVNQVYQLRSRLSLAPLEKKLLFRTLVAGRASTVPGWFWFQDFDSETVMGLLCMLSADDSDSVQRGALAILTAAAIQPVGERRPFIEAALSPEHPKDHRSQVIKYIGATGDLDDVAMLQSGLTDGEYIVRDAALSAHLEILSRHDPGQAIQLYIEGRSKPNQRCLATIEQQVSEITTDILTKALNHADLSSLAFRELVKRNELQIDFLQNLTQDPKSSLRIEALRVLAGRGIEVDLATLEYSARDLVSEAIFATYEQERLEKEINWFRLQGPVAYKVLAQKAPDRMRRIVQSDIKQGFERIRRNSEEQIRALGGESGKKAAEEIISSYDDLKSFIRSQYLEAAFEALSLNPQPEDAALARAHLNGFGPSVRSNGLKVLERCGDSSDACTILKVAKDSYGEAQAYAYDVALKLSPGKDGVAPELLRSGDAVAVQRAVKSLITTPESDATDLVLPLLRDSSAPLRYCALAYLVATCTRTYLEKLLTLYPSEGYHYYDVVCWLDRILYAPEPLREVFRRLLIHKNVDSRIGDSDDSPFPYSF